MIASWPLGHSARWAGQEGSAVPGVGRLVPLRHPRHPSTCNCYCGNELSHPSFSPPLGPPFRHLSVPWLKAERYWCTNEPSVVMYVALLALIHLSWRLVCTGEGKMDLSFFSVFAFLRWLRLRGKWVCVTPWYGCCARWSVATGVIMWLVTSLLRLSNIKNSTCIIHNKNWQPVTVIRLN